MRRVITISALLAALALLALISDANAAAGPDFSPAPAAPIPNTRMYELSTADQNDDGYIDMFTTSHKFRSAFLKNNAGSGFSDQTTQVAYNAEPAYPGIDWLAAPDDMSAPGLYLYPTDHTGEQGEVHLISKGVRVTGVGIFLTKNLKVLEQVNSDVEVKFTEDNRPYADFTIRPGGRLTLSTSALSDLPVTFKLSGVNKNQVYVGPLKDNPDASAVEPDGDVDVTFRLRDRHGLAFADVGGNGAMDLFVSTGGLGGGIADPRFTGLVQDQLLIMSAGDNPGRYGNRQAYSKLDKGTCRGRAAEWVDFNRDGRLDLFQACESQRPEVFRQTKKRGQFKKVVSPPTIGTVYRWIQLDSGRPVLLSSTSTELQLWQWNGDRWIKQQRSLSAGGGAGQIAIGDYDGNGLIDIITVDEYRMTLFANKRGQLQQEPTAPLGLPSHARSVSFVDYDNDGWSDLYVFPSGLYRYNPATKKFNATGGLSLDDTGYATSQWVDFNNDGRRDPVVTSAVRLFAPSMQIIRRMNTTNGGHWLEADLHGNKGNREAIGAKVTIWLDDAAPVKGRNNKTHRRPARAGDQPPKRIVQWVGQNDDAPHSQGHYRVYFGLGGNAKVSSLEVKWPDGSTLKRRNVRADQILDLNQR